MKKLYHFCISAGNEVMFRSEMDYIRGFNSFAVALARTGSIGLVESFMSTHFHGCVVTDNIGKLIYHHRASYSRYFNNKYFRHGPLGEQVPFFIEVVGVFHRLAALSYTLRNALHHGVSPTPFAYPFNSSNAIFRTELGKPQVTDLLPRNKFYHTLPDKAEIPEHYKMDKSGLLLRESVLDVRQVEYFYNTPRNYLFYMNRLSGEEWEKEQMKEEGEIFTLETIESGVRMNDISSMLRSEHGRENYGIMSDLQLCKLIDEHILPEYGVQSVYQLDSRYRKDIANGLWQKYRLSRDKIERCLVL